MRMTKTDLVVYAYFLAPFFSAQFSFPTYNNGTPVPKAGIIRAVWLLFASLIELQIRAGAGRFPIAETPLTRMQ